MTTSKETDTVLLDKLRAGLLDDRPDLKTLAEQSLAGDPSLQSEDRMVPHVLDVLNKTAAEDSMTSKQLRLRRRAVLSSAAVRPNLVNMPRLALGAAVSLLLAMTIGWLLFPNAGDRNSRISALERDEITDLTDNLDFYTWLERRGNRSSKSANGT